MLKATKTLLELKPIKEYKIILLQAKAEDGKSPKYEGEWSIEPLNTDPLKG